ncbi:hypothetical protein EJB05_49699, partial [Eragrostis curvula]
MPTELKDHTQIKGRSSQVIEALFIRDKSQPSIIKTRRYKSWTMGYARLQIEGQAQDSHEVNIAMLAGLLNQELAAAESSSQPHTGSSAIMIGDVGSLTRNVDPAEYDPHHVSIGPYHRINNPELARDDEKIRCLRVVLSAASAGGGTRLEGYLDELARLEVQARRCYVHSFPLDSEMFLRMLLLDACYLLVRFGGVAGGHHTNGAGGSDKLEAVAVVRDVFYLAENQIPFFVVEKVHQLTFLDGSVSAADTIGRYVRDLLSKRHQYYSFATPRLSEPGNLLHLVHMHFNFKPILPSGGKATRKRVDRWRTATEYYFAGVKFKRCHDGARCILDVRLNSGSTVLEVPRLNIDAETWPLLRNLMALEQRNPETTGSHVTAYCVFMSQLACTAIDVDLLCRSGVIAHGLGNNAEVSRCFADLCKGVVFSVDDHHCNYLRATCQALEKRYRSQHGRWVAWLRQKYFRNPWLAVGLAAAVVGLVCTVVQAVYSVLSYNQGGAR